MARFHLAHQDKLSLAWTCVTGLLSGTSKTPGIADQTEKADRWLLSASARLASQRSFGCEASLPRPAQEEQKKKKG